MMLHGKLFVQEKHLIHIYLWVFQLKKKNPLFLFSLIFLMTQVRLYMDTLKTNLQNTRLPHE